MARSEKSIGEQIRELELQREALQVRALAQEIRDRDPAVYKAYLKGFEPLIHTPKLEDLLRDREVNLTSVLGGRLAAAQKRAGIEYPEHGWPRSLDMADASLMERTFHRALLADAAGDKKQAETLLAAGKREKAVLESRYARGKAQKEAWRREFRTVRDQAISSGVAPELAEEAAVRAGEHAKRSAYGVGGKLYALDRRAVEGRRMFSSAKRTEKPSDRIIGPSQRRRQRAAKARGAKALKR